VGEGEGEWSRGGTGGRDQPQAARPTGTLERAEQRVRVRTIETPATVAPDGRLTVQVPAPADVSPGEHRVVVVIEEALARATTGKQRPPLDVPGRDDGPWPEGLSRRREDR
jgi:hypothetical protein